VGKVIIKEPDCVDIDFLYWLFLTPEFNQALYLSASGTKILHTSPGRIEAFQFHLPPPSEQRSIAHILGALDDKIELNRRMNATLEATARALFKSWFVDFDPVHYKARGEQPPGMDAETAALFPDSFEENELGVIPAGWRIVVLRDIADLKYGKFISKADLVPGSYPVFSGYSVVGYHQAYIYDEPQIVVVCRGIGGSGDVKMSPPMSWITNLSIVVAPKMNFAVPKEYLYWYLLESDLSGAITGSAQYQVTINHLQNQTIMLPNERIQRAFATFIESINAITEFNTRNAKILAETRDALLPKLVSGALRVGEVDLNADIGLS
jgi:type I restriction enzyme S subunit